MKEKIKIAVLGGDKRQSALAKELSKHDFDVYAWGIDGQHESVTACNTYKEAISFAHAVILPLPATNDNVTLNCNINLSGGEIVALSELMENLNRSTVILAGKAGAFMKKYAWELHLRLVDYFDSEALQIKNAVLTAEGAINIMMNEMPVTVMDSRITVTGYGRIGRALAVRLRALGADVTVAARSERDLANAASDGCLSVALSDFRKAPGSPDVIFNTIPYPVIDKGCLAGLDSGTLIIDLASSPGGVDMSAAEKDEINVIWALSLPGKTAPVSAGKIICDTAIDILRKEKII